MGEVLRRRCGIRAIVVGKFAGAPSLGLSADASGGQVAMFLADKRGVKHNVLIKSVLLKMVKDPSSKLQAIKPVIQFTALQPLLWMLELSVAAKIAGRGHVYMALIFCKREEKHRKATSHMLMAVEAFAPAKVSFPAIGLAKNAPESFWSHQILKQESEMKIDCLLLRGNK